MNIGLIGVGGLGGALARRLAGLGHQVAISNSRGPGRQSAAAAEIGATAVTVLEAARTCDLVIVSIPTRAIPELPQELFMGVPDRVIVVDTCNYHPQLRDGSIEAIDHGMLESWWVAQQLGRPVIKAFNNIFAASFVEKGTPTGTIGRIALSVAGDQPEAKATVFHLVDDLGFDQVDTGGLDESWRQQTGTPAYCRDLDAAGLRRALAEAAYSQIADYRAREEARIRKSTAAEMAQPDTSS